jgi:hypothetical protein
MKKVSATTMLALLLVLLSSVFFAVAQSSKQRIEFPQNYKQTMALYTTLDRADGKIYEIYINRPALETWRNQRRLPSGTQFVIESFTARRTSSGAFQTDTRGRLVKDSSEFEIHVSEKRNDWANNAVQSTTGLLFGQPTADGQWRMDAFDPRDGSRIAKTTAQIAECHQCHTDRRAEDFILSRGLLDGFVRTGQPSYIRFSCKEREICF